jgi:hypothetical protein
MTINIVPNGILARAFFADVPHLVNSAKKRSLW